MNSISDCDRVMMTISRAVKKQFALRQHLWKTDRWLLQKNICWIICRMHSSATIVPIANIVASELCLNAVRMFHKDGHHQHSAPTGNIR